jgi:hypothetical protein
VVCPQENRKVCWKADLTDVMNFHMMALTPEFLQTASLNHFQKVVPHLNQKVWLSVLMVLQPTVLMDVMTYLKKLPEIFWTLYLTKTFVQMMIEMPPKMYGMRHFLSVRTHQTGSLPMLNISAERLKSFSLIPW